MSDGDGYSYGRAAILECQVCQVLVSFKLRKEFPVGSNLDDNCKEETKNADTIFILESWRLMWLLPGEELEAVDYLEDHMQIQYMRADIFLYFGCWSFL